MLSSSDAWHRERAGEFSCRVTAETRRAQANAEAERFRSTYETLLARLDGETVSPALRELFVLCRDPFTKVAAYQKPNMTTQPIESGEDANALSSALRQCRESALKLGDVREEQDALLASALRRFASSGMVLLGVSTIAQGNIDAGLALWREGSGLLEQDKAGFKLTLESFRGW